jgi:hypothetical protein
MGLHKFSPISTLLLHYGDIKSLFFLYWNIFKEMGFSSVLEYFLNIFATGSNPPALQKKIKL